MLIAQIEATRPTWAYVLNEDADGELTVLFPIDGLDQQNPLPADTRTQLPGTIAGQAVNWEISRPSASDEFVLILADHPLATFTDRLTSITSAEAAALAGARGAARLRADALSTLRLEGAQLRELVEQAQHEAAPNGSEASVRIITLHLPHAAH
jgi:hypothetical protein